MRARIGESFLDSNSIKYVFRKNLSVEALNERLRKRFKEFDDARNVNRTTIPLVDALMSACSNLSLRRFGLVSGDEWDHRNGFGWLRGFYLIGKTLGKWVIFCPVRGGLPCII